MTQELTPVAKAIVWLGLTDAGAAVLMRANAIGGRLQHGLATQKLVKDGFARRIDASGLGFGKTARLAPKGHEAVRVLLAAGWNGAAKKKKRP